MSKSEIAKLVFVVMNTYPNIYKNYKTEDTDIMVKTWMQVLGDIPYKLASIGLNNYLKTEKKGFPPSPGQIRNEATEAGDRLSLAKLCIGLGMSDGDVFYNTGYHIEQVKQHGIEVRS